MRKPFAARVAALTLAVCLTGVVGLAQSTAVLRVSVLLVDSDLNVKPVPRHVLFVRSADGIGDPVRLVVGFDGKAEIKLAPGTYILESDRPVEFQGRTYHWKQSVVVQENGPTLVELSVDNAVDDRAGPVRGPAGASSPRSAPSVSGIPDLRGTWQGTYADSIDARLTIDRQDAAAFSGTLVVVTKPGKPASEIQIEGKLTDRMIDLTEMKVITLGGAAAWRLGVGSGTLQTNGRQISGTGIDAKSSYKWAFERQDSGNPPAAMAPSAPRSAEAADLRGTWDGTYADSPAVLTIDLQDAATWSGTLVVTTKAGKEASEIQVTGAASQGAIDIREVKVLKLGAAPSWKLGAGSGSLQADGHRMRGTGKDDRLSYTWSFDRRDRDVSAARASASVPGPDRSPSADLQGTWNGAYAGSPAELTIDHQDGSTWTGTLVVTTKPGKPPSEIQVAGKISGSSIELREVSVLKLGAALNWNLGAGSGAMQADGHHIAGTGRDDRASYQWSFARR